MSNKPKPVVLAILDGWGIAPPGSGNAITQAKTPNIQSLWLSFVRTQLIAHGESVGLPKREPGNTETGHLNIGAGRIVYQDLPRINMSIADGTFFQNQAFLKAINHAKSNNSSLHLMGLIGGGGVHSDLSHVFALLRLCHEQHFDRVYIHLFTDGRDSPPNASLTYIAKLTEVINKEGLGKIASVMGRYFAMDRDFRWDRIAKAYFCLTKREGLKEPDVETAIKKSYALGKTDEFIEPTVIIPEASIKSNDAVIFYNFRIDRPRELTRAFTVPDFEKSGNKMTFDPYAVKYTAKHQADEDQINARLAPFDRGSMLTNLCFVTLTEYEKGLPVDVAYPPSVVSTPLARAVSQAGLRQLRMSESEKERFVTYYFSGLREDKFPGEDRLIVPSPKVATYDKKPEMSAIELTDKLIEKINENVYDLIIINYANADMVGHTGNIKSTIIGCETIDVCIGRLSQVLLNIGGVLVITADHGNAEEMINRVTGEIDTEHNANPVPFIVVGEDFRLATQLPQGILADVAPTILSILRISPPTDMIGRNLLAGRLK